MSFKIEKAMTVPYLFIKNEGDGTPTKVGLLLTNAPRKFIVRFTGGCGNMDSKDAIGLCELFTRAFEGFQGVILYGGTRMLDRDNPDIIVPSITEIPPLIKKNNPGSVILGVVPRPEEGDLRLHPNYGLVISEEVGSDFVTIIHPEADMCLVIQKSADMGVIWDSEFKECIRITDMLLKLARWEGSLLISYNGGGTTEKEILATAKRGWPVLLIAGSGRVTGKYAADAEFLKQHPNVYVAEKDVASIRDKLIKINCIVETRRKKLA